MGGGEGGGLGGGGRGGGDLSAGGGGDAVAPPPARAHLPAVQIQSLSQSLKVAQGSPRQWPAQVQPARRRVPVLER